MILERSSRVGRGTPCAPGLVASADGAHGVTRPTLASHAGSADRSLSQAAAHGVFEVSEICRSLRHGGARRLGITRAPLSIVNRQSSIVNSRAFSLIEVLVVISLMSLIVLALMAVFNTTQRAFRASVTQTDVLEGSRAAVDLITSDLRSMTPSGSYSNGAVGAVNFSACDNNFSTALAYWPLQQNLPGTTVLRTNVLNYFFLLGRENMKWIGVGYAVGCTNTATLYPLYRFYAETNIATSPRALFDAFSTTINNGRWTNMSHVMDGVVHLVVRAYDPNGYQMTNIYQFHSDSGQWSTNKNVWFLAPQWGEVGFYMFSNTIPASVELQLGVVEDRVVQRAESLPNNLPALPPNDRRTLYLQGQSGSMHIFRQRVTIPNVDPAAYR